MPTSKNQRPTLQSFQKKITYTKELQSGVEAAEFNNESNLVLGTKYRVDELIEKMIIDSDNGATSALISNIPAENLNIVYDNLGIARPNEDQIYKINIKDYSLFLRVLFNATYLSPENSEKALEILSRATYANGIVAGIPAGTTVSHKYGEHVDTDSAGNPIGFELHDCGLVYAAQDPYLLCVMTKGKQLGNLENVISTISKKVTDAVEKK